MNYQRFQCPDTTGSGKQLLDHAAMHIRQPEVPAFEAESEGFVVDP
jgi:hypothetical protein